MSPCLEGMKKLANSSRKRVKKESTKKKSKKAMYLKERTTEILLITIRLRS
jgi:hypothetical protein